MGPLMAASVALAFVACTGLAVLVTLLGVTEWMDGATLGLFVGVVLVSSGLLQNYLYEQRSVMLWKINAGYTAVGLAIAGALLATWL